MPAARSTSTIERSLGTGSSRPLLATLTQKSAAPSVVEGAESTVGLVQAVEHVLAPFGARGVLGLLHDRQDLVGRLLDEPAIGVPVGEAGDPPHGVGGGAPPGGGGGPRRRGTPPVTSPPSPHSVPPTT